MNGNASYFLHKLYPQQQTNRYVHDMERNIKTYSGEKFQSNHHLLAYLHAKEAVETAANHLTMENHKAALQSIDELKKAKFKKDNSMDSKRISHYNPVKDTFVSQPKGNSSESRKFKYHRSSYPNIK